MKKLIILENNSEFKGFKESDLVIEIKNNNLLSFYNPMSMNQKLMGLKKVQLYIIDTDAEINLYDEFYDEKFPIDYPPTFNRNDINMQVSNEFCHKIIACNNPLLPLPQLSPQAIELIIEKNGEIGEFDIEIKRVTQGHSRSLKLVEIANIIPKSSKKNNLPKGELLMTIGKTKSYIQSKQEEIDNMKDGDLVLVDDIECIKEQSIEEAAEEYETMVYYNTKEHTDRLDYNSEEAEQFFIAGAKSNAAKEYWFNKFKEKYGKLESN